MIKEAQLTFATFLTLHDRHLFKYFFLLEKARKGCLLREIREIYLTYADNGEEELNSSLLKYFKSDISDLSHLKYLLNRINNEKKEFHYTHESMYAILVKAMQIKLRVGGPNDIPIDEVLIYLENIPITRNTSKEIIWDLEIIQKVNDEYPTLKQMNLNMTIREIIDNYEIVMEKLVDHEISKHKILEFTKEQKFMSATYRLLAETQSLKKNLYGDIDNELAFFIFLTKLM